MPRLNDRIAIVTGAARGIGRAIATAMAREGATVIVTDIHLSEAEELAETLRSEGCKAAAYPLDVSDSAACEALAAAINAEFGPASILVNNAGVILPGRIDAAEGLANWNRTLAINVGGPFNMCRAFYPQLRDTRGAVINLASIRSFVAAGNAAAYAASKGAVMQLTKALAVEWGAEGIRVNAIAPGFVESSLVPDSEKTPEREAAIVTRTPLRRQGQPDEVSGAAIFLASDEARYVTGVILPVDGGYLAG
jgi:meso-butanediol dehydrogenase / (S,S)-butanediol dehydrogenase / diacetyl reductase